MPEYIFAITKEDYEEALALFNEYATWLNIDLSFQNFEAEKTMLPKMYGPPGGMILLVKEAGETIACIALRKLAEGIAELKRMYVKPDFRYQNIAGEMLRQVELFAKEKGYKSIKLDTLSSMIPAMNFYRKHGYTETTPYYYNPNTNTVYFEKVL